MRALIILFLLLPAAQAVVIEDPAGDLEQSRLGQDVAVQEQPHWDLVAAEVAEGPEAFTFRLEVAGPLPTVRVLDSNGFAFAFVHGGQEYRTGFSMFQTAPVGDTEPPLAGLWRVQEDGNENLGYVPVAVDGFSYAWSFPRGLFIDVHGAPPVPGARFEDLYAVSGSGLVVVGGIPELQWESHADRAPDQGGVVLEIEDGLLQEGARLGSPEPFRVSNG